MTFPTGTQINTTNLDSPADDPNLARVDLLALVQAFNQLVASANTASGVAVLTGAGKISSSLLPGAFTQTGTLQLQPGSGRVNLQNVLRLQPLVTSDVLGGAVNGTDTPAQGDLVFLSDGDAGQPCLGCYDGSGWKVIRLMTAVGDVGAGITATSTLTAEAD